jgi:hypothetical protein
MKQRGAVVCLRNDFHHPVLQRSNDDARADDGFVRRCIVFVKNRPGYARIIGIRRRYVRDQLQHSVLLFYGFTPDCNRR